MSQVRKGKISKKRGPILQYSYTGEFIKEYPSITDAAKQLNYERSKIIRSLQKKVTRPTISNPYIFIYKEEDEPISVQIDPKEYYTNLAYKAELSSECIKKREQNLVTDGNMANLSSPVEQYTLDRVLIAKYYSLSEASRQTGVSVASIRKQINDPDYINKIKNKSKTKYIWKRADANDPDVQITKEQLTKTISKKKSRLIQAFDEGGNLVKQYNNIKEFEVAEHADRRTMMASIVRDIPWHGYYWKITGNI